MRQWISLFENARPTPEEAARVCADEWPDLTAKQECCDMSARLQAFLIYFGYDAETLDLSDHVDASNRPNASTRPEWDYHYVVALDGLTYDLTYRQFDPSAPCPLIRPLSELEQEWRDIRVKATDDGWLRQMEPGVELAMRYAGA